MASELRSLLSLLTHCVEQIETSCKERNVEFPSLDAPFSPAGEAVRMDPGVIQSVALATTAAYHFYCAVRPAAVGIVRIGTTGFMPANLRTAVELNVVEILREAGPNGLHVKDIATKTQTKVDAVRLSRVLRYLATHHVFREVSPDVFANNWLSGSLDKGKPVSELVAHPELKYSGPEAGNAALFAHVADEPFKGAAYLYEYLVDPETAITSDPAKTPFTKALGIERPFWALLEEPDQQYRLHKFGAAMAGITKVNPPSVILHSYEWSKLPKESIVVDVGSGVGSVSLELAKAVPNIKVVLQDRAPVIEDAKKYWEHTYSAAIAEQRVTFQPHDFFKAQPVQGATVYLLRMVLHDWSDPHAQNILKVLREAAGPKTELVILDTIVPYACADTGVAKSVPGALRPTPPPPLLPNMGVMDQGPFTSDMTMLTVLNGIDRTLGNFVELLQGSGWKIDHVQYNEPVGLTHPTIVAVPA